MTFKTLVDPEHAVQHLSDANWAFVDCRFLLSDPGRGFRDYQEAHIQGAVYADLDKDLSGPIVRGKTGRHPLPDERALEQTLSRFGIDSHTQVVTYDDAGGYMAAARLWWMLNWAGHEAVAILDGGFKEWLRLGYPTHNGIETRPAKTFVADYRNEMLVNAGQVADASRDRSYRILDARASDRYRGENETMDPVAGHIPGALNVPFIENLEESGRFKSPESLKKRFDAIGGDASKTIFYCGSGVTAAHNVVAFLHAGMGVPRLYAGSWSEWITDPHRPVVVGDRTE